MKTKFIAPAAAVAAAVTLVACTAPEVEKARGLKIEGRDVAAEAAREYRRLAIYEDKMMWDRASAVAFSEKALAAMDGRLRTQGGDTAALAPATAAEIEAAYRYLNAMMQAGAGIVAPKAAGQAVARLDCWAEQAGEGYQPLDIRFCRDGFRDYAEETALALKAAGRIVPEPKPQPMLRTFSVSFPYGSATPGPQSKDALDAAAAYALSGGDMRIVLGGHADRSGSPAKNQRLSQARADAVARMLRSRGVPAALISTIGFGETYPRVATPDGQKSADNRRVEIVIGPATTL